MSTMDADVWGPAGARGRLCVDTSGLFAYFYPADVHHEEARRFFNWLKRSETSPWRLYVNDYVIDELCSLLARKSTPKTAIRALQHVRASEALRIERVPDEAFDRAMETFIAHEDQTIPFTDHVVSAHADLREADVFSFDHTDFNILGNEVIPRWSNP